MKSPPAEMIRIGELAKLSQVNVETVRYYERRGLVLPTERRDSGYREYSRQTVALVRFIKRAQHLGFSLDEISDLLRLPESNGRTRKRARALAASKATDIDERIRQLSAMREALGSLLEACDCGSAENCAIIEALDEDAKLAARP